jgi:hypothetical protein
MTGTIQQVPVGNTIPYTPFSSTIQTQIALDGSIASGNFGGTNADKASKCWLHLVFQDTKLQTGTALGACEWFTPPVTSYNEEDKMAEPIQAVSCKTIPVL